MRVLRVFHGSRDPVHRRRDRALVAAGHDVTLVVPSSWPEAGHEVVLSPEPFRIVELPAARAGDVNRHTFTDPRHVRDLIHGGGFDLLDLHTEPVGLVTRQILAETPAQLPVVMYTAQNIDKRFPPPFARYECEALQRAGGMYPCSRQAASVVRGKGFTGVVRVLPIGYDDHAFVAGTQSLDDDVLTLGLVGRMVPSKGVLDAVEILAATLAVRPARLLLVGEGPELEPARARARQLGVGDHLEVRPWMGVDALAATYREMHVCLVPSTSTSRWVEQFGRVIVEAQASGAVVAGYASGAIADVVGGAGVLAAEGDLPGLCRRVGRLLGDEALYADLRSAGLALATTRTWSAVAAAQSSLYAEVVSGPPPTTPTGRRAARAEFGPTALSRGEPRPFALPVLRDSRTVARLAGGVVDRVAGLR